MAAKSLLACLLLLSCREDGPKPPADDRCRDFQADTAYFGGACPHPDQKLSLEEVKGDVYAVCRCRREEPTNGH